MLYPLFIEYIKIFSAWCLILLIILIYGVPNFSLKKKKKNNWNVKNQFQAADRITIIHEQYLCTIICNINGGCTTWDYSSSKARVDV